MIKFIFTKLHAPIQTFSFARKRKQSRQKMMSYCLKIKPTELCATYKINGAAYETISNNI